MTRRPPTPSLTDTLRRAIYEAVYDLSLAEHKLCAAERKLARDEVTEGDVEHLNRAVNAAKGVYRALMLVAVDARLKAMLVRCKKCGAACAADCWSEGLRASERKCPECGGRKKVAYRGGEMFRA